MQEYVDPTVNLVLIQLLINGEIASGAYLIRNSEWAREFLGEILAYKGAVANPDCPGNWSNQLWQTPGNWSNQPQGCTDNGIFLVVLAKRLLQSLPAGLLFFFFITLKPRVE